MLYFMNFSDLAVQISPSTLEEYLKNTGWHLFPRKRKDIRVYQITKDDGSFFQVTIPIDENLADYKYAMEEAVKTIMTAAAASRAAYS